MTEQAVLGVIEVLNRQREDASTMSIWVLSALASVAAIIIDNMRMANKLKFQRQQLNTIEQDIHKSWHGPPRRAGAMAGGISMNLEYILRLIDINLPQAKIELEELGKN